MNALGRHILAEYYNCDITTLDNSETLAECMRMAVRLSGATIINSTFHQFSPHGISGVIVIAESHMAIHTWPEYGYAAVDFFTCGDRVDPWKAINYLKQSLRPEHCSTRELERGVVSQESEKLMHAGC